MTVIIPNVETDDDAIHDNVPGEIDAITEKVTPVGADQIIIEDSAAGDAKKKVQISNLPAGAPAAHATSHENGGGDEINVAGLSGELADNQPPKAHDLGGADHNADTLANLNTKVSDATLDDSGDSRAPNGSATGDLTGTYPAPTIAADAVSNAKMANMPAHTVKVNNSGGALNPVDLVIPEDTVLGRNSGVIVAGQVNTDMIAADAVTDAKLDDMAANTAKVNATAGSANPTNIAMAASTFLARLASGNIVAATVAQIKTLLGITWHPNIKFSAADAVGLGGSTLGLSSNGAHIVVALANTGSPGIQKSDELDNISNNIAYDGSNMNIVVRYSLESGQTIAAKNIKLDLTYILTEDGDDIFSGSASTATITIDLTGKTADEQQSDVIMSITGAADKTVIGLKILRDNGVADNFAGDVALYAGELVKV